MFTVNQKVKYKMHTTRKKEGFSLSQSGQLTILQPMTKKELCSSLADKFLEEINKPLANTPGRTPYTMAELKVVVTAV